MAELIANVHVEDRGWYGPAHGNADQVPPAVAALITNTAAWGESQAVVAPEEQLADGTDLADLLGPSLQPVPPSLLEQLALLPDDKAVLVGFAKAHSVELDLRKGAVKMRADLQQALA